MKKYEYENKKMHEMFFRVLECNVPSDKEESLCGVMDYIQDFFDGCYWVGINPVREMRHILPQYKWQFYSSKDKGLIRNVIADSQLIWRVNWIEDEGPGEWAEEIQLVTAKKFGRTSIPAGRLFFAGQVKKSESSTGMLDFVMEYGGDPVYAEIINA